MSELQTPTNQAPKWLALAAGLLVAGGIGFWLFQQNQPKMVTELYRYYPQNTAMFMEIKPSQTLASKIVRGLDSLSSVIRQKQGLPNTQLLSELFNKDFEPTLAAGVWQMAEPAKAQQGKFLAVITLKKGVSPQTILTDMKLNPNQYEQSDYNGAKLFINRSSQAPSMAFHNNQLLLSDTEDTLKASVDEYKTPESLLTQPFIKQHIGELPAQREGTILVVSSEMQALTPKNTRNQLQAPLEAFQEKIRPAFPGTLAAIQVSNDRLIKVESSSPMDATQITDATLRSDMVALLGKKGAFSMPGTLPESTTLFAGMVDLAGYYDFFLKYIAPSDSQKMVEQASAQLKVMGLDLRKNIVALLEGPTAVGVANVSTPPQIALFLNHSADTVKTLDQLSALAAQMTGGRVVEKQLDSQTKANIIESRFIPVSLGYSAPEQKPLVFGTTSALETMATVSSGKAPAFGNTALYKELTSGFPQQLNNIFFLNTHNTSQWIDALSQGRSAKQAAGSLAIKQLLNSMDGVAMATTMDGQRMVGYTVIKLSE